MTATTTMPAASRSGTNGNGSIPDQAPLPVTDEMLLKRLRDGAPSAGEELIKRYFRPLMRYLQRLTHDDHLAEELYQQTWVSVLDNLDKFDAQQRGVSGGGVGGFKAWLFRIATNKANDHWRGSARGKAARNALRIAGASNEDSQAPPADHRLEGREEHEKLKRAIEQLPESQRQVLMLRYYSNLKFVEIADLLGCPLNTALGRMHKAVMKLRELME